MQSRKDETPQMTGRLSRRRFLLTLGLAVGTGSLAACATRHSIPQPLMVDPLFHPQPVLPSPQPAASPTPAPESEREADGLPLADFLALSAVLTGVGELNPQLGTVYLQSLQASSQFDVTLVDLYEQAGFRSDTPPATVAELEANGLFAQEASRQLADKIIEYWYTGIYETAEGAQAVATFVDTLVWQTLKFTKPLTICGAPNFWSHPAE
jgi:hypothetical protein